MLRSDHLSSPLSRHNGHPDLSALVTDGAAPEQGKTQQIPQHLLDRVDEITDKFICPIDFEFVTEPVYASEPIVNYYNRTSLTASIAVSGLDPLTQKAVGQQDIHELSAKQLAEYGEVKAAYEHIVARLTNPESAESIEALTEAVDEYEKDFLAIKRRHLPDEQLLALEEDTSDIDGYLTALDALVQDYNCPITHTMIEEAVVTQYGNVFNKSDIEAWLAANTSCPLSRRPLENGDILPFPRRQAEIDEIRQIYQTCFLQLKRREGDLEFAVQTAQIDIQDVKAKYKPLEKVMTNLKLDINEEAHLKYWQSHTGRFFGRPCGSKVRKFNTSYRIPNGIERMMQYLQALKVTDIDGLQRDLDTIRQQRIQSASLFSRMSRDSATRAIYEAEDIFTAKLPTPK